MHCYGRAEISSTGRIQGQEPVMEGEELMFVAKMSSYRLKGNLKRYKVLKYLKYRYYDHNLRAFHQVYLSQQDNENRITNAEIVDDSAD